jgi:hypothetical protein
MTFWTDYSNAAGEKGARDPKRAYKFYLQFTGIEDSIWYCKKVTKPSFTVSETPHKFLNHTFYYPGKVEWNTVSITLVDPVEPDVATSFANVIKTSGYNIPSGAKVDQYTTISKGASVAALGDVVITQIDSQANALETWTLQGCWIKDLKFGDLDYDSEDFTLIEMEIRYDWATLQGVDGGSLLLEGTSTVWDPATNGG